MVQLTCLPGHISPPRPPLQFEAQGHETLKQSKERVESTGKTDAGGLVECAVLRKRGSGNRSPCWGSGMRLPCWG